MSSNKKKTIFSRKLLLMIQLIVSLVFLFFVYRLKMLPIKYYLIVVIVICVLLFVMNAFMISGARKKRKENKPTRLIVSKVISALLSLFLVVTSVFIVRGDDFINNISGSRIQTRVIALYSLKDSNIKKLSDVKKDRIGVQYKVGKETINDFQDALEDEAGKEYSYKEYDDYIELSDALYDGKIDAIILDQAYLVQAENKHEDFNTETRVLFKVETEENLNDITTATDVTGQPFIIYLTGLDTYGTVSTVSRTDVNLILCVNPTTRQILMVSIPRDTEVTLHRNGKMDKLTHSAIYGIDETISTMEDFLDMNVNFYAKTNFQGITNIVDALGGITVNSPYAFSTTHGDYKVVEGENNFNGDQALCFVRERYKLPNGDLDRGKNQQLLLQAMIKKALSTQIITNYNNILSAVEGSFETNMSGDEIKSLVNMQLDDGGSWEMFNVQLSGSNNRSRETFSMKGQNVFTLKPHEEVLEEIRELINKVEDGKKIKKADVESVEKLSTKLTNEEQ